MDSKKKEEVGMRGRVQWLNLPPHPDLFSSLPYLRALVPP
jgi:hypothetical protein